LLLAKHRFDPDVPESRGRYDYLVGAPVDCFHDPATEGQLPADVRRSYAGRICDRVSLPIDLVPGALVTPDGTWHDLADFGWKMMREPSRENQAAQARWESRYRELIALHPHCWVVEVWAHS